MKTKNEDIIKKLFESKCSLSPEERAALNNYEYVNDTFHRQWEEMSEEAVDLVREEKILNGIMKKVRGRRFPFIKKSFYKYGMAAMIAVCMVLSALLLMKNSGEEIIYVVNTGYQSMDSVRLADGTKVMLNAGSRLTYPKEFSGEKREVQLSGQGFFEVTPDKTHPFVVKTQKMDVTVLGTSFEVFSYDGDEEGETVLLTGKVKVEVLESNQQKGGSYVLKPNEKLTYSKTDGISLTTIDADAYSSWRQGKRMSFKNETLEMILERLEKWYGQKIECAPHIARHYRFTFTMHSESLDLILNYISHSAPLNYRLISKKLLMTKKKLPVRFTGQHFTIDKVLIKDAIRQANISNQDTVLDIGAGKGFLTVHLLKIANNVVAIENDTALVEHLRKLFSDARNVQVVGCDFRNFAVPKFPFKVVSNIPYGITSDIFKILMFESLGNFLGGSIVLQLEPTQKLFSRKLYNPYTVFYHTFFDLKLVYEVGPESFLPPPTVKSALLNIKRKHLFFDFKFKAKYLAFISCLLEKPDLSVKTALKSIFRKSQVRSISEKFGLNLNAQIVCLSPSQWLNCFLEMLEVVPEKFHPS